MNELDMIRERHSVRAYQNRSIEPEKTAVIRAEIERLNALSGLHMQLIEGAEGVFDRLLSRFWGWRYVPAYIALAAPAGAEWEEKCGYYGEALVLFLQSLGLNTCWVGLFRASAVRCELREGERTVITIAVGYGESAGHPHKSKPLDKVTDADELPDWFRAGVECALLAPTAMNQQGFVFSLRDGVPSVRLSGRGPFAALDLGIVKYHFEVGSGRSL